MEGRLQLYKRVYSRPRLVSALRLFDHAAVAVCALSYLTILGFSLYYDIVRGGWFLLQYVMITGVPFVAVSLFRHLIDLPRPYEVLDMSSVGADMSGRKEGHSFPSRHVFSAFAVGAGCCFLNLPLGIFLLILGTGIAVGRVLRGIHFIRDVVAGALIGAITSSVGMLIVMFC